MAKCKNTGIDQIETNRRRHEIKSLEIHKCGGKYKRKVERGCRKCEC